MSESINVVAFVKGMALNIARKPNEMSEEFKERVVKAVSRIEELERIATEYEANKHYIELGNAVEKAFEISDYLYAIKYHREDEQSELCIDDKHSFEFGTVSELLEWAEGRE